MSNIARALTIAGSDSGGGAGIQADLKTFEAHGVYGMSALTSITAQNTVTVTGVHDLPASFVAGQIDAVAQDIGVDAAKTGMLSNAGIVEAVADAVRRNGIDRLVVDPVMISKHGAALLAPDAAEAVRGMLLPRATLVTPNLHEAGALVGREVATLEQARDAARAIADLGAESVLVKGGHLDGAPIDVLLHQGELLEIRAERIDTTQTHGTGCTYGAAITARLARGDGLVDAVRGAKAWLTAALRSAPGVGHGVGPVDHFAPV